MARFLGRMHCFVFGHNYRVIQAFSPATRRVYCFKCGGDWAMNDRLHVMAPWNGEFAEFYKENGHLLNETEGSTMTNETTASQTKSIGDDALSEFIDEYEWRTDEFCHKPTEAERLMLLDFAVNLDDSRTPAAQASATIQAAPEGYVIHAGDKELLEVASTVLGKYGYALASRHIAELQARITLAATIQQPVMVAEPVLYVSDIELALSEKPDHAVIGYANKSTHRSMPLYAAPMVAEPAGVAVDHDEAVTLLSAVFDAWENGDDCHEDGDPSAAYMGKAFKLDDEIFDRCCALLNRLNPPRNISAATVKAVPSEALELPGLNRALEIAQETMDGLDDSAQSMGAWYVREAIALAAAPLAGKTGGGE